MRYANKHTQDLADALDIAEAQLQRLGYERNVKGTYVKALSEEPKVLLPFVVRNDSMTCSNGVYHVVTVTNTKQRPVGTHVSDSTGRMQVCFTVDAERAMHEADKWAKLLGAESPAACTCLLCEVLK